MAPAPAALAIANARILAMPDAAPGRSRPWEAEATAMLWDGPRVLAVGTDAEIRAKARALGVEPKDLGGRVVLPGFVDAHTHFLHVGVKEGRPDLREATGLADAMARLAAWLEAHPGTSPVIGEGWDESEWPGHQRPTRADLDAVEARRPVVLRRICGHVAVANSAALPAVRARWDDARVDPATGVLLEEPSLYLNEVLPTPPAELDRALARASAKALALGVTTVGDYSQAPYRAALQRAAAKGALRVRVASSIYVQQLDEELARGFRTGRPAQGPGGPGGAAPPSPMLRDGGLKVFLDGSLGAHTAALREPYCDHSGADAQVQHPKGKLNWSDARVAEHFGKAHRGGVQIHAHAIGDAAIDQGLAAFEGLAAGGAGGDGDKWAGNRLRHRFEHFEIVHDAQIVRAAALRIVSSSQPNFVGTWSAKGGMYEERLGARFRLNNRFQAMKAAGLEVAFGSDGMPFGPLPGIQAAVAHPEAGERMGAAEAVWHYTNRAAWSLHWEDAIGSLEPGKMTDFVVLDATGLDAKPPLEWRVESTWVAGQQAYRDPGRHAH